MNGLDDLEADWQETVTEMITHPPLGQILKVSVYTPTFAKTVPIAPAKRPALPVAA